MGVSVFFLYSDSNIFVTLNADEIKESANEINLLNSSL